MSRHGPETAHLNTDLKKLHANWDLIDWTIKEKDMEVINKYDENSNITDHYVNELEAQLKEAHEVIGFYGDTKNWQYRGNQFMKTDCDASTGHAFYYGKRAREYQAKHKLTEAPKPEA